MIGCFGRIVFEVSSEKIETVSALKQRASAKYATHDRHLLQGLTEFTGAQPQSITFDMVLSAYLGANPSQEIFILEQYLLKGEAQTFVLGGHIFGSYKWVIDNYEVKAEHYDHWGNITSCTVTVSLLEYTK